MVAKSSRRVIRKASGTHTPTSTKRSEKNQYKTETQTKSNQDHRCSRVAVLGGVYVALEFLLCHLLCLILIHGIESSHTNRIEHAEHRKHSNTFFRRWLVRTMCVGRDARTVLHAHLKPAPNASATRLCLKSIVIGRSTLNFLPALRSHDQTLFTLIYFLLRAAADGQRRAPANNDWLRQRELDSLSTSSTATQLKAPATQSFRRSCFSRMPLANSKHYIAGSVRLSLSL